MYLFETLDFGKSCIFPKNNICNLDSNTNTNTQILACQRFSVCVCLNNHFNPVTQQYNSELHRRICMHICAYPYGILTHSSLQFTDTQAFMSPTNTVILREGAIYNLQHRHSSFPSVSHLFQNWTHLCLGCESVCVLTMLTPAEWQISLPKKKFVKLTHTQTHTPRSTGRYKDGILL